MKLIRQSVALEHDINGNEILRRIESAGRTAYKSQSNGKPEVFIAKLIKLGHESVLEHCSVGLRVITDRWIAAEFMRHRLSSYTMESTRYCNYKGGVAIGEQDVFERADWGGKSGDAVRAEMRELWEDWCATGEKLYKLALMHGLPPQDARIYLPGCLKTEFVVTENLREWRHVLKLRCDLKAHHKIRKLAIEILGLLHDRIPVVFDDLAEVYLKQK